MREQDELEDVGDRSKWGARGVLPRTTIHDDDGCTLIGHERMEGEDRQELERGREVWTERGVDGCEWVSDASCHTPRAHPRPPSSTLPRHVCFHHPASRPSSSFDQPNDPHIHAQLILHTWPDSCGCRRSIWVRGQVAIEEKGRGMTHRLG